MLSLSSYSRNMKTLLVVLLYAITVYGQETVYGMQMPSFSSSSGPSGSSRNSGTSSPGMGWDSLGPASVDQSGGGRIVGNSILDLDEPNTMEVENENMQMVFRQQEPSVFPMMINRPVMTGPSIGTGQILEPTRTPARPLGMSGTGTNANSNGISNNKVHRYVSVHIAPPEPMLPPRMRTSQANLKPETHYQILFIKAPSSIPQEVQQIQLPPPPQMKTLVYVLLKKDSMSDLLKISQSPKVRPAKPEVFFIRYKGKSQQSRDEQKPETEEMMMTSPGNMNGNNGIGNNDNEQITKPRSTSTTIRPSEAGSINRGMGMVQLQGSGGTDPINGGRGMVQQQGSGATGPINGGRGMVQQQGSGATGPINGGWGMVQTLGVTGPVNKGIGIMQASGGSGPANRGMGMIQASGGSGPVNRGMGMVQSSGGSGTSNTGMQMGMGQALGGYDNAEIADSDFSSDFNENQYLQAYRRQHHQNQRPVRSGFTFLPSRRYGIVN